jgi:hypothetical protein
MTSSLRAAALALVRPWREARYRGGSEPVAQLGALPDLLAAGDALADALAIEPALERETLARALYEDCWREGNGPTWENSPHQILWLTQSDRLLSRLTRGAAEPSEASNSALDSPDPEMVESARKFLARLSAKLRSTGNPHDDLDADLTDVAIGMCTPVRAATARALCEARVDALKEVR